MGDLPFRRTQAVRDSGFRADVTLMVGTPALPWARTTGPSRLLAVKTLSIWKQEKFGLYSTFQENQ